MSSKIGISPDEITAAIQALPASSSAPAGGNPLAAAMEIMRGRPKPANQVRVIFYRYDMGDARAADALQEKIQGGTMPLHDVCQALDCDLQLIELGAGDSDATESARACAFGMMAAEQATGLLVVAALGAGSSERISDPNKFFGTATPEVAAMMGAMVAAARAGIPIIAEGHQGLAAVRALKVINPALTANVFICGIKNDAPGFHVFADHDESDTGYSAIMLAALLTSEFGKMKAA